MPAILLAKASCTSIRGGDAVQMVITNRAELLAHGNAAGRRVVLDVLEAGLRAPDPYANTRRIVRVEGRRLIVGDPELSEPRGQAPLVFDLDEVGAIYVLGGGKAVQRIAEAVEDALGELITDGQINAKRGDTVRLKRIPVTLGGHPLPDEARVAGARRILDILRRARKGDIVFYFTSGGGTALTALPAPGISLDDLREVYRVLYFGSGANMPGGERGPKSPDAPEHQARALSRGRDTHPHRLERDSREP